MKLDTAHTSHWEISEVVFGLPLLAGIGLQLVRPLSLPAGPLRTALIPVGAGLFVLGVAIIILARREFARFNQSMEPGQAISKIVRTGVFSISRNPLYLGISLALDGIGLAFNALWIVVMLVPAMILCHYILIAPEERYLKMKFSAEYLAYAADVRRWFGRR